MKHLLTVILLSAIAFVVYVSVDRNRIVFSHSMSADVNTTSERQSNPDNSSTDTKNPEEDGKLLIDTVMYAKGHSFGYDGDISEWGGWYLDTIFVGDDIMLKYDSVGPSALKLSLVTRELTVDLGDPDAVEKIRMFMGPVKGFRRFQKKYEECLDSVTDEEYGTMKYMGEFSFTMDYPDSSMANADKINRFISELTKQSESEKPTWDWGMGSCESKLEIRTHIANKNYVTFSKYKYYREGFGHGMYTETFHTFDLEHGNELRNSDIFKSGSLDKVRMTLFEVMKLKGKEVEETESDVRIQLPEGALTESGVVFSFQPYEIDCWAAGAFHFIVPYKKLWPYLTEDVKGLIIHTPRACRISNAPVPGGYR